MRAKDENNPHPPDLPAEVHFQTMHHEANSKAFVAELPGDNNQVFEVANNHTFEADSPQKYELPDPQALDTNAKYENKDSVVTKSSML